jgi:hypothetical protein
VKGAQRERNFAAGSRARRMRAAGIENSLLISLLAGSPTSIIKHLADYWRQVATGFGDTRAGSLRMLVRMLFWENMEDSPVIFSGDV